MMQPTDEILEEICDAAWHGESTDAVCLRERHLIDPANGVYEGTYTAEDGEVYDFTIEIGNMRGTVVLGWGDDAEGWEPPARESVEFVPVRNASFEHLIWYARFRETEEYRKLCDAYAYDSTFDLARRGRTFLDQARNLGLYLGSLSDLPDWFADWRGELRRRKTAARVEAAKRKAEHLAGLAWVREWMRAHPVEWRYGPEDARRAYDVADHLEKGWAAYAERRKGVAS